MRLNQEKSRMLQKPDQKKNLENIKNETHMNLKQKSAKQKCAKKH